MKTVRFWLTVELVLASTTSGLAWENGIAPFGNPPRLKIEGAQTFTAEEPGRVRANVDFTIHDGPPKLTGQASIMFGLGLNTKLKSHGLCRVHFKDTPVSLLSLTHEYHSNLSWDGDILTVAFRDRKVSANSVTGELREFRTEEDESVNTLSRTSGEFQRRLNEIDTAAVSFEPADSSAGPLAGALALYCDAVLTFLTEPKDAADRKYTALIHKLSDLGILEPIDRLVLAACSAPEEAFDIPDDNPDTQFWKSNGEMNVPVIKYVAGRLGIQWSDVLATPGTWPWDTWREAMFALADKSRHLERELIKHLSQQESGPIRHLVIGELLRANDMQAIARVFGLAGQAHLGDNGFRNDYLPLLDEQSLIGHCLLKWADVIRQLDEADIQTLCKMLVEDEWMERGDARIFASLARRLRHDRASPVSQALAGALDAWWKAGLREYVARELRDLATGPRPATGGGQTFAAGERWRYRWHRGQWWYYGQNRTWQYWTGNTWQAWPVTAARRIATRR